MSEKKHGGAAFPFQPKGQNGEIWSPEHGMTLRDYFAGQALAGILAGNIWKEYTIRDCPEAESYRMADKMLEERDR